MVHIVDLIGIGLHCPNCKGVHIRGGYHDWQTMDSFICEDCGLHWNEDFKVEESLRDRFSGPGWRFKERGFIWVMCDSKHPLTPILNPDSADGNGSRKTFVRRGMKWVKKKS